MLLLLVLFFCRSECTVFHAPTAGALLLPAATKLGQGNIFTSVCQEFLSTGGGRVSASVHAGIHQPPPQPRRPPGTRPPPEQTHTPGKQTAAYSQWAAGTHPTGMHSYCRSECAVLHAPALRALPEDERCEGADLLDSSQNPRVQHPWEGTHQYCTISSFLLFTSVNTGRFEPMSIILLTVIKRTVGMGLSPIPSIIHTVTIGTMLNNDGGSKDNKCKQTFTIV